MYKFKPRFQEVEAIQVSNDMIARMRLGIIITWPEDTEAMLKTLECAQFKLIHSAHDKYGGRLLLGTSEYFKPLQEFSTMSKKEILKQKASIPVYVLMSEGEAPVFTKCGLYGNI